MVQLQMSTSNDTTKASGEKRPFFDAVVASTQVRQQLGENGMVEYTTEGLGSNLLALSQMVRSGDPKPLARLIMAEGNPMDVAHLFVWTFVTRNTRGGKGEKKLAYQVFLELWKQYPHTCTALLPYFPHYGYWKDYLLLMELGRADPAVDSTALEAACLSVMEKQLRQDMRFLPSPPPVNATATVDPNQQPPMSLLVKWLPRENSPFDTKLKFVKTFSKLVFADDRPQAPAATAATTTGPATNWQCSSSARYRKTLSQLTERLNLPEVLLAAQREDEIQLGRLASKATLRLRHVFLNETKDGKERSAKPQRQRLAERFLKHTLEKGLKGGQLMPHEIVASIMKTSKISKGEELVLSAQWKSLRESVLQQQQQEAAKGTSTTAGNVLTRMVPLSDVSGSMSGVPMEVSIAMGILVSEITPHPAYRNLVMTFESQPRWHRLHDHQTIVEKVRSLQQAPWGGSTDFAAAYDLLLSVVVEHRLAAEDMPTLIVFSDMQFDEANGNGQMKGQPIHDLLHAKVAAVAKQLEWTEVPTPTMVYWNLRNAGGHPVDKSTEGAVLLAGFSPSVLKLVMDGTVLEETEVEVVMEDGMTITEKVRVTPEQVLLKMLQDDLYNPVRVVLGQSQEGQLAHVEIVQTEDADADDTEKKEMEDGKKAAGDDEDFETSEDGWNVIVDTSTNFENHYQNRCWLEHRE